MRDSTTMSYVLSNLADSVNPRSFLELDYEWPGSPQLVKPWLEPHSSTFNGRIVWPEANARLSKTGSDTSQYTYIFLIYLKLTCRVDLSSNNANCPMVFQEFGDPSVVKSHNTCPRLNIRVILPHQCWITDACMKDPTVRGRVALNKCAPEMNWCAVRINISWLLVSDAPESGDSTFHINRH